MASDTSWEFSRQFLKEFYSSSTELTQRADEAQKNPNIDTLDLIKHDVAKLAKSLIGATGSLPAYDQRQCEAQIKDLERALEDLRTSTNSKPKFSFKKRSITVKAVSTPSAAGSQPTNTLPNDEKSPLPVTTTSTSNLSITSRQNVRLDYSSLPALLHFPSPSPSSKSYDLTISDIDGCVVNLLPPIRSTPVTTNAGENNVPKFSSVHIKNVRNTVLLLPIIEGSTIIHESKRCTVAVGCQQFRAHLSDLINVYLSIPSNPVIEHCSRMYFTSYPTQLLPSVIDSDTPFPTGTSNHLSVQDFLHIRATPSPNWSVLPDEAYIKNWPLLPINTVEEINEILLRLLPTQD